ncbi:MAG TPA: uroporphyrinogen-III synthase [Thermoplasmata archaeon]|nr:uroporphyrinogen-III synthase [Thermoplasmata archaeon]
MKRVVPAPKSRVVLVAGTGGFQQLSAQLRRRRVPFRRIAVLRTVRVAVDLRRFGRGRAPVFVVSSPSAARHFVRRLPGAVRRRGRFYAAGAATAATLRAQGCRAVVVAHPPGLEGTVRALVHDRIRDIYHPTSDLGIGRLPRLVARARVKVDEFVAYRTLPARALARSVHRDLDRATHVVASSPSALRRLRMVVTPPRWRRLCRSSVLVAPGALTARSARRLGFREVHQVASLAGGGFTPNWLDRLADA